MAHKQLENGRVVVDWTTGDHEGDRIVLLSAYRDFINELKSAIESRPEQYNQDGLIDIFKNWNVDTENQVDEVPRIWIKRPHQKL